MPHAAIIVTGAFIVGVAAWAVYKEVIEPSLERRRQEQEEEWSAQEVERAIQLSILEQQHEEQRRAEYDRWEQSHASSSSARYNVHVPTADLDSGIRRRRHADPFSDEHEMQEVSSHKLNASTLFDAGPSSRLDTFSDRGSDIGANPPMHTHGIADDEDTELLETARSLSLTYRDGQVASDDDLMNSHNSTWSGSNLDAYSIIEPDSRPGSHSTSRSHSPLIVDIDPQPNEPSFHTPPAGSQQDLTAASLEQMQAEQASAGVRAASPTPTIRSMTRTLENDFLTQQRSEASPSYIADSRTPSQVASSSSRAISPFSELENVSAVGESDKESQWSDLGEDSSDEEENEGTAVTRLEEEEQQDLRDKRQRYFAALSTN